MASDLNRRFPRRRRPWPASWLAYRRLGLRTRRPGADLPPAVPIRGPRCARSDHNVVDHQPGAGTGRSPQHGVVADGDRLATAWWGADGTDDCIRWGRSRPATLPAAPARP